MPDKTPARTAGWPEKLAGTIAAILFIAFVVWLANGVVQGGWVMWFGIALFAAPIVGILGFYAWIAAAFMLDARRNLREAERARQAQADAPPAPAPVKRPGNPRRRRSRGSR